MEKKGSGNFLRVTLLICLAAVIAIGAILFLRHGTPAILTLTPKNSPISFSMVR